MIIGFVIGGHGFLPPRFKHFAQQIPLTGRGLERKRAWSFAKIRPAAQECQLEKQLPDAQSACALQQGNGGFLTGLLVYACFSFNGAQMFNWNDLVFFLELARQGRLMPAARRLRVDYTTVSRRVSELEKDLAVTLFERKSDGFVLTEEGHQLFGIAERMEALSLTVDQSLTSSTVAPAGRVRLATMEGIAAYYLTERFGEFNAIYPEVIIELVTERYLINLTKREADVSVSFVPPIGPRLSVRKAGTFGLGLFASASYLGKRGMPATKADLKQHDFVDYVVDLVAIPKVHWLLDVLEPESVVFRSTSMAAQQNAVASGRGLGLLPYFSARRDPRLVQVLADLVRVERDLYVSVHEDIEYVGRVRALTKFLCDLFVKDTDLLNRG